MLLPEVSQSLRPWIKLHVVAAEHGDCAVVRYGTGNDEFCVVVDAGLGATPERLMHILDNSKNAIWELLVISHVDLDHIEGTISLLSESSASTRFKDIWFNGRQHLDPPESESLGVKQGKELQALLEKDGIAWNRAFNDGKGAVCVTATHAPVRKILEKSGAAITVLSPSLEELAKLRVIWDMHDKAEKKEKMLTESQKSLLPNVEKLGTAKLNIAALAGASVKLDTSAQNGSSIAFIFEFGGKKILFGADAHEGVLRRSAAHLKETDRRVDVFKLPHHGSAANVTPRLLQAYPSSTYVFSTSGAIHNHPDDIAIARVVVNCPNANLIFNYSNKAFEKWSEESHRSGSTFNTTAGEGEEGIVIDL